MRSFVRKAVKIASALYLILALACGIAGLAILVTIFSVGGSPGLGYVEGGHYFVGNHGHYTEVSAAFFNGFVKVIACEEGLALLDRGTRANRRLPEAGLGSWQRGVLRVAVTLI